MDFLRRGETTDSLRVERKLSELRERLTMLVIVGMRIEEHSLRSQVCKGSEWDCLLGQLNRIYMFAVLLPLKIIASLKLQLIYPYLYVL